jgi:hypothetical protein
MLFKMPMAFVCLFFSGLLYGYCPGELGESLKALAFRNQPPHNLHQRIAYLDHWAQTVDDSIGLKILFFRALHHQPKITWEEVLADMTKLKNQALKADIPYSKIVDRPAMPSFKIFDPSARDVVAAEVAEIRKTFNDVISLDFIDHLLIFSTSPTLRDAFIRELYITYKLVLAQVERGIEPKDNKRARRAIKTLYQTELEDIDALRSELIGSPHKESVVHAALNTLADRFESSEFGTQVFRKWTIKVSKTLILFDKTYFKDVLSEDAVKQATAIEGFYSSLPLTQPLPTFHKTLREDIVDLRSQVPTLFHEWEHKDLRKKRRAGYVEFLPLPRVIAAYSVPAHLRSQVFNPNTTFYLIERGLEPAQLLGVRTLETDSGEKYMAITQLPDFDGPLLARLFGSLQIIATELGLKGVMLPKNMNKWPASISAKALKYIVAESGPTSLSVTGKSPISIHRKGVTQHARAFGDWLFTPKTEPHFLVRRIESDDMEVHPSDARSFEAYIRGFLQAEDLEHLDLEVVEQIEILLELMKRSKLPDALPIISTLKDLYKIVFEDRVQEFLESDPRRSHKLTQLFIKFFQEHDYAEVRYHAIEILEKIMKRELGISVEVAHPNLLEKSHPIDWNHQSSEVLSALTHSLKLDTSHRVRLSIMVLLARLDIQHFFDRIIERAHNDSDERVQRQAVWYLKIHGKSEHTSDLKYIENGAYPEQLQLDAHEARLAILEREGSE